MARRLIALDLPGGPDFVAALQRAFDDGDAIVPIDQRLPPPARQHLIEQLRPEIIVTPDGPVAAGSPGRPVADGDAVVIATSGTTGAPRGVVLTHGAIEASAAASSRRLGVTDDDVWLACLPLSHVGGLSVVTRAISCGQRLIVHPRFDAEAAEASGATLVSLVATALGRINAGLFRRILLGGGPAPQDRPTNCVMTYGMTETASGVVYDGVALDGVEIRTRERGLSEILIRAPMLLRAYRGPDDDIAPPLEDGWFPTSDLGTIDDDGRLSVAGRAGDLIITGGENVWPEAVERVLVDIVGIADLAIGATADPEWGQAVTAYVVPDPSHTGPAITLADLRARVREHLPAFCAPRRLVHVDTIPRTALGKIQRTRLTSTGRSDPHSGRANPGSSADSSP